MSRTAISRLPLSGLLLAILCLLGSPRDTSAQGSEQGRICEVKPAMRCLDKAKIEGTTLRVPIDAAAIQKDGFLICDSSFNYTTAPDIVLIMDNTLVKGGNGINVGVVTFSQTAEAKSEKLVPLTAASKDSIKSTIVMEERG